MEYKHLKNIAQITMGQSPKSETYNNKKEGLPFFQGNADFGEISPKVRIWCSVPKKVAHKNDILISVRAPIGALNIADTECCIGRGLAAISVRNIKDRDYIFNALKAKSEYLKNRGTGSTFKAINKNILEDVEIPIVSTEKRDIEIKVLNKLNIVKKQKEKELSKLDTLIKARFVEMFGDPLRNDRTWPISKLKLLTTKIGSGATPKGGKQSYKKEGITLVRSMNVHDGEFVYKDLAHIDTAQAHDLDNVELQPKDVFINITGASVARSCVIPDNILPGRVNQHVAIIRCKENLLNYIFLNRLFLNSSFKQKLLAMGQAGGATRQALTKEQLKKLNLILPPIELQNEFASFVQQVDKSKVVIQKSLDETQTLFDSLMQKYFS
jgi:type I restriction enzyme S subunit